ncbi:glutathione transferase GstA [Methylobacterium sp. 17Sr1-1]|uniref:glutathione transferase GstA n=1 Tax=Methylobacterium sp. 17Sr1-1 TaxID=2202826 RepID=UPI000D6FA874|nr:glutathione transferase GstA [Methylobacterium sp. 17Sr1-1]AWN50328.1 glutathione transferase GstA [Methylobacterium sp. 17Sr1-1]
MKLYFAPDTCSLSPHIVLQELGLPYDLVRVNNRTKRTSDGADFLSINPKGYVAALVLDGGEVLTEGPAILQYLADLEPSSGLAPPGGSLDRIRLQEWLNFITAEIHAGPSLLFDRTLPDSVQDTLKARLFRRLAIIDSRLSQHPYLMGEGFTVADAYLFAVLGWMPAFSIVLDRWPALPSYLERVGARPSVTRALSREREIPPVEG